MARLHSPTPRVSLPMDQPWETGGYITVFRDGDRYRMYDKGDSMRDVPGELERAFGEVRNGVRS